MNVFRHRHVRGYSLIELMIAILISMIILSAVGYVFMTARSTQRQLTQIGRTQESARFVLERVSREIRQAGYVGCKKLGVDGDRSVQSLADPVPAPIVGPVRLNPFLAFRVFNSSDSDDWFVGLPSNFTKPASAVSDSPVIEVRHAADYAMTIDNDPGVGDLTLKLAGNGDSVFKADSLAVLTNCSGEKALGAIVRIASVNGDVVTLNPGSPLTKEFARGSQIAPLRIVQFFVGTSTANPESKSIPTLMQREMNANGLAMLSSQPLFDHVRTLDLVLGIETPDADTRRSGKVTSYSGKWSAEAVKYFPTKNKTFDETPLPSKDQVSNRPSIVSIELILDVESQKSGVATDGGRLNNTFSTVVSSRNRQQQIN